MKNTKKCIALSIIAIFAISMFCACGDGDSEEATETTAKATITAGEAAENASQKNNDNNAMQETTQRKKTGTEDPAIDAAKAAAYEDIQGFDGKWKNISVDVDDVITTIEFDWNGNHYQYQFDQESGQIIR